MVEPTALVLDVLARRGALEDRPQERRDVRHHHLERRLAVDLVLRLAHRVRERLVHERVLQVAVDDTRSGPECCRRKSASATLRLQRIADADVVLDVRHHRERAADAAAELAIGEQRECASTRFALELPLAPLVGHRSRRRRRDRCSPASRQRRRPGRHVLERVPEDVVGGHADPGAERLVGEADLELAVEVQDRQADAVGDEAQPMLALARLELQLLQVVDVAVRDQEAADMALRAAVGVVVDADPQRRAAGRDELALVGRALARQRGIDVRPIELEDVAAEDLDRLAAQHLAVALAEPVEERLVDETVALVAVDVGDRDAKRIELALGEREQRVALDGFADGVDRQVDAVERASQRHLFVGYGRANGAATPGKSLASRSIDSP
jgi:hypothetical protein